MTTSRLSNSTWLWLLVMTVIIIPLYYFPSISEQHQASARCPNGFHKSPSGECEAVTSHEGLSRCPNGYHRSPRGICEAVNVNANFAANNNNNVAGSSSNNNETSDGNPNASSLAGQCDQTLWNHVYNPTRLQIIDLCLTVTGIIDAIRIEQDGDYHILVDLDSPFANMINSANIAGEQGDLVVGPICKNPITQPDAISVCGNWHQNITIPDIGSLVNLTGSYVHDLEHGGWSEIHPITSIVVIK